jgi:hypothetical protein
MKSVAVIVLAAMASASLAQAQTPGGPPPSGDRQTAREAVMKACDADLKNYCADKQRREAMMCLRSNSDKLIDSCKSAMSALRGSGSSSAPPPPQ